MTPKVQDRLAPTTEKMEIRTEQTLGPAPCNVSWKKKKKKKHGLLRNGSLATYTDIAQTILTESQQSEQ